LATGGLYGNSPSGILSYFTWFIFIQNGSQPATPTGGTWNFLTNVGTPPAGWSNTPIIPTTSVWMSRAIVSSQSSTITWSSPVPWASVAGVFSFPSAGIVSSTGAAWSTAYSTSGSGTVIPLATSPSIVTPTFTGTITGSQNRGAITYGNLSYNDVNLLGTFQQSVNGPTQFVVQNTNAGATASANFIAVNNISTATTNYAKFGINSSGFSGTGAFNQPNYAYLTSTTGDLAIGTTTANAIHFVVNSGATDAMTIANTGSVTFNNGLTGTLTGSATSVSGTVAIANGGTGSTTAPAALIALGERTSATGSIIKPIGTTAQRDGVPAIFYDRGNTTTGLPEWYNTSGATWIPYGGEQIAEVSVASATTTSIGAAASTNVLITGTTTITAFDTVQAGIVRKVRFNGVLTLTYNATTLILPTTASINTAANDCAEFESLGSGNWICRQYQKANGTGLIASSTQQIQPISASVAASALTISASALALDFRSATLTSGAVTTVSGTPANLVISSGSTLGTVNATQSRIVVLALNNAGNIELAAVNIAGGNDLSETGLISTTAEGGAGAADSASTVYSTTARTSVAYRVIGYIESTQATAGTWATAPSTIQGQGGQALAAMSSLGYGQTWQNVAGSRAFATTYYNTTGKPIELKIKPTGSGTSLTISASINGAASFPIGQCDLPSGVANAIGGLIVPAGASYSITQAGGSGVVGQWYELR